MYRQLITKLVQEGTLKTPDIIRAFYNIKRQDFLKPEDFNRAHLNSPLAIGFGQTNSQPFTVAFMLELLHPKPGDRILDAGCGTGWTTALMAYAANPGAKVFGLEILSELRDQAIINIAKYKKYFSSSVDIILKNAYEGLPEKAPFDRILVSAASKEIPSELVKQLAKGGRAVLPIGENNDSQNIVLIKKDSLGEISIEKYPGFIFVPLIK